MDDGSTEMSGRLRGQRVARPLCASGHFRCAPGLLPRELERISGARKTVGSLATLSSALDALRDYERAHGRLADDDGLKRVRLKRAGLGRQVQRRGRARQRDAAGADGVVDDKKRYAVWIKRDCVDGGRPCARGCVRRAWARGCFRAQWWWWWSTTRPTGSRGSGRRGRRRGNDDDDDDR